MRASLLDQIRDLVVSGTYAPGVRLDEQELATQFAVSRTPVREALRELASSGLIELRPRRGAYVRSLSPAQLDDHFVAMAEMEGVCARLAAMSMLPSERRELQRLHESMGEMAVRELIDEFEEANEQFHAMIHKGAHNVMISEMTISLRDRLRPHRKAQFRSAGRVAHSHEEHGAIARAIVSGDAARAHAAMLHHLAQARTSFHARLAAYESADTAD
jgi:DNA-binding GntR family transcriptional regulator